MFIFKKILDLNDNMTDRQMIDDDPSEGDVFIIIFFFKKFIIFWCLFVAF